MARLTQAQEKVQELQDLHDKLVKINKIILEKQKDKIPLTIQGFLLEDALDDMRELLVSLK